MRRLRFDYSFVQDLFRRASSNQRFQLLHNSSKDWGTPFEEHITYPSRTMKEKEEFPAAKIGRKTNEFLFRSHTCFASPRLYSSLDTRVNRSFISLSLSPACSIFERASSLRPGGCTPSPHPDARERTEQRTTTCTCPSKAFSTWPPLRLAFPAPPLPASPRFMRMRQSEIRPIYDMDHPPWTCLSFFFFSSCSRSKSRRNRVIITILWFTCGGGKIVAKSYILLLYLHLLANVM